MFCAEVPACLLQWRGKSLFSKWLQIPTEWQAPRRQLHAAFVCSPTKGKHVSFILTGFDKMSQTVKQRWRNVFSPLLAWKEAEFLWLGCCSYREKHHSCICLSPLILTRGSTWRVQVKVLPVRSCGRLQPSDKLGINNLEINLYVHLGALLSLW